MKHMNLKSSVLLVRVEEALRLRGWYLTEALDAWHRGRTKLMTYYVLDSNADVLEHYTRLIDLAMDLQVILQGEMVDGRDWSPAERAFWQVSGPVTQAQLDAIGELIGGEKFDLAEYTKSHQERSRAIRKIKPLPECIASGKFVIYQ